MLACKVCSKNGFPNEMINLDALGEDAVTGKMRWKATNENGEIHQHKGSKFPNKPLAYKEQLDRMEGLIAAGNTQLSEVKAMVAALVNKLAG